MSLESNKLRDGRLSYSYKFRYRGAWYRGYIGAVSRPIAVRAERQARAQVTVAHLNLEGGAAVPYVKGREPKKKDQVLYFVYAEGLGLVKIGVTTDIKDRLETLSAVSPVQLILLGTTPGNLAAEQRMHEAFADHRKHHEWFRLSRDLLTHIHNLCHRRKKGLRLCKCYVASADLIASKHEFIPEPEPTPCLFHHIDSQWNARHENEPA